MKTSIKFNIIHLQSRQLKNTVINKPKKTSFYLPDGQYDVYAIEEFVNQALATNKKRIETIVERLQQLELIIQLDPKKEMVAHEEIFTLKREMRLLVEITNIDEFRRESKQLLDLHNSYEVNNREDFFVRKSVKNTGKLDQIVDNYIILAKRYIEIPPRKYQTQNSMDCEMCGSNDWDNSIEGGAICINCGLSLDLLDVSSVKNNKIVKTAVKNNPLDKHLLDAITQMECKQSKEIPEEIYDQIKSQMTKKDIGINRLTKTNLHEILQYIGYTEYHDVHKLHYDLTKKEPIEISKWSSEIMADHILYQRTYNQIKEKSNAQNKFYKLLRMCMRREGFVPKKDDWFMIKEKIILYEADVEKMYAILEWDYEELNFDNFL